MGRTSRNGSLICQNGTLRPVNEPRAANERARIRLALGAHDLARVSGRRGYTVAVAVTVREVDAAHTAVPVDALVSGETTTCLFRSAGSLGPPVRN